MSALKKIALFPVEAVRAWAIGMAKLWNNDLHPHPSVRAGMMVFLAAMFALTFYAVPHLKHAFGRAAVEGYLAAAALVIGWVSYLFNHRWRHAFF